MALIRLYDRYTKAMSFAQVIAVLACIDAFHAHFTCDVPALFSFLSSAVDFLYVTGKSGTPGADRTRNRWPRSPLYSVYSGPF